MPRPISWLGVTFLILALALGAGSGSDGNPAGQNDGGSQDRGGQLQDGAHQQDGTLADGTTCFNKCTDGVSQCIGVKIQTCSVQPSGCTDWNEPTDCPNGRACNGGRCPDCTDECSYGNTQCVGTQVQRCVAGPYGCTVWDLPENCPGDLPCSGGTCPTCENRCVRRPATRGAWLLRSRSASSRHPGVSIGRHPITA